MFDNKLEPTKERISTMMKITYSGAP